MAVGDEKTPPTTKRRTTQRNLGHTEPTAMTYPAGERPRQTDGYDEGLADSRSSTSAVRFGGSTTSSFPKVPQSTPVPPRRQKSMTRELPPQRNPRPNTTMQLPPPKAGFAHRIRNMHWLFLVGFGMALALLLWLASSNVVAWGQQRYNDFRYGTPRTFHTDKAVGHGDSAQNPSHFVAMNWDRQAVITEFKAGDPKQMVSYIAPIYIVGDNGQAPVTLDFRDVNNDKHLDMIVTIHLPNQQFFVFINEPNAEEPIKGKFRPSTSTDAIKL